MLSPCIYHILHRKHNSTWGKPFKILIFPIIAEMSHPSEKTEAEKLAGMLAIHAEMTRGWKASKFHAVQKEWLEKTIFPLKLVVDSALSMGVGSIQGGTNSSYKYDKHYGSRNEEQGTDLYHLSQVVGFECWIDILSKYFAFGFLDF